MMLLFIPPVEMPSHPVCILCLLYPSISPCVFIIFIPFFPVGPCCSVLFFILYTSLSLFSIPSPTALPFHSSLPSFSSPSIFLPHLSYLYLSFLLLSSSRSLPPNPNHPRIDRTRTSWRLCLVDCCSRLVAGRQRCSSPCRGSLRSEVSKHA